MNSMMDLGFLGFLPILGGLAFTGFPTLGTPIGQTAMLVVVVARPAACDSPVRQGSSMIAGKNEAITSINILQPLLGHI